MKKLTIILALIATLILSVFALSSCDTHTVTVDGQTIEAKYGDVVKKYDQGIWVVKNLDFSTYYVRDFGEHYVYLATLQSDDVVVCLEVNQEFYSRVTIGSYIDGTLKAAIGINGHIEAQFSSPIGDFEGRIYE